MTNKEAVEKLISVLNFGPVIIQQIQNAPWTGVSEYVDTLRVWKSREPEAEDAQIAYIRWGWYAPNCYHFERDGNFVRVARKVANNIAVVAAVHMPTRKLYQSEEVGSPEHATYANAWERAKAAIEPDLAPGRRHATVDMLLGAPDDWSSDTPAAWEFTR